MMQRGLPGREVFGARSTALPPNCWACHERTSAAAASHFLLYKLKKNSVVPNSGDAPNTTGDL